MFLTKAARPVEIFVFGEKVSISATIRFMAGETPDLVFTPPLIMTFSFQLLDWFHLYHIIILKFD